MEGLDSPASQIRSLHRGSGIEGERVKDPVASVRSGYDRWAAVYERDANPLQALEEPVLRAEIGDVCNLSVLDLGCGTGRHSFWLVQAGASVTAVDFSPGMLAE